MRSHGKIILTMVLGALLFSAVSAGSAFASTSWKIEGKELKAGETAALSENITSSAHIVLQHESGWGVECLSASEVEGDLEGPNLYNASELQLKNCAIIGTKADREKCTVPSTIKTEAVQGTLTVGTTTTLTIKPLNSEALFTTLTISGTCNVAGRIKIKGVMGGEFTALGEQAEQPLSFTKTSGSKLTYSEESLLLTGQFDFALASGEKWAA